MMIELQMECRVCSKIGEDHHSEFLYECSHLGISYNSPPYIKFIGIQYDLKNKSVTYHLLLKKQLWKLLMLKVLVNT